MTKRRKKAPNLMRAHPSFIALCADLAADWKRQTGFEFSQTKVTEVLFRHLQEFPPSFEFPATAPAPNGALPAPQPGELTP